jgi:hypothetical protein
MRIRVPRAWTLAELGQAAGLHRARVRRLLEAQGVALEKRGRTLVVATADLRGKTPKFWRSLEAVIGWGAMRERAGLAEGKAPKTDGSERC